MNCDNQCCENHHHHHHEHNGGEYGINVNTLVHTNELLLVEQAAELVPVDKRKPGTKITFWTYSGWETWQFISKDVREWLLREAWKQQSVYGMDNIKDLQNQIDSIQIGGWAISQEFGDDEHIGISQKKLTEEFNNVARLDDDGKVPPHQLPSYVDDVIDGYFYNNAFYADDAHTEPIEAETGKIYVDVPSKISYRYSGSAYIAISNPYLPDEEDITAADDVLKFKDKSYNAASYSGLGRKYLRKNLISGVNTLTQAMLNTANTEYVVQYDYDLGGNEITVPANCVLKFEGGSISNGTVVGNDTTIDYTQKESISNAVISGTYKYSNALKPLSNLDTVIESGNILDNPFFKSSDDWTLTNCTIDGKLIIDGEGTSSDPSISEGVSSYASQVHSLSSGHRYLVACYAKVSNVYHSDSSHSHAFYGRYGIGFRIKDATPVQNMGEYTLNLDFIGNREKGDFVPIVYVLDVYRNANPTVSFGQIYTGNGYIEGEILHAGLYDITEINSGIPDYKDLYLSYKEYVERVLQYKSPVHTIKYPDSMADLAFMEEMNMKAKYMYMNNTSFGVPSGLVQRYDAYNDGITYMTILQPSSVDAGKIINQANGNIGNSSATTVYTYDNINPRNKYFIQNLYINTPNSVSRCFFYKSGGTSAYCPESYKNTVYREEFYGTKVNNKVNIKTYTRNTYSNGKNTSYDAPISEMINVPEGYSMIKLMSDNEVVPQLVCLSEAPINGQSQAIDYNYGSSMGTFRSKDTVSTAKDICILNGIAATDRKIQEVWNRQKSDLIKYSEGSVSAVQKSVQLERFNHFFNDEFYIIYGKGGSYSTNDIGWGLCVKDRSNDKWFSICLARYGALPQYNDVTALPSDSSLATALQSAEPELYAQISALQEGEFVTVENSILATYYPDIDAKKQLNTSYYKIIETLINWYQEKEGYWYKDIKTYANFSPNNDLDWDCCAVCQIYPDMPFVYNEITGSIQTSGDSHRYETTLLKRYSTVRGKNIEMAIHPMSITKTMTVLTAMEYMNLSDYIEYKEGNFVSGSGSTYSYGTYFTLRDSIIFLLGDSDNSIATNICNQVGQRILEARYGK